MKKGFYFRPRIDRVLLERYHEGLACTSACIAGEVAFYLDRGETTKAEEAARWYKNLFGEDYYLEVTLHPAIRRHPEIPKDAEHNHIDMFQRQQRVMNGLLALGKKLDIPCLASNDVHFVNPEDVDAHDVWLALGTDERAALHTDLGDQVDWRACHAQCQSRQLHLVALSSTYPAEEMQGD